ncbi:high-potential iron-sulfur protein [Sphingobium aromaticiconvertens]|uniref:high-potential iron-sulfur protein n=1 Tax=Sphingobium aromaticiconvertens TaxID=365341 RepID=UPI003015A200
MREQGERSWTRRSALILFACMPLAISGGASATAGGGAAGCGDAATLSAAQKSMRKSLGFKAPSPDAAKRCALCTFFTPGGNGCGQCALLSGSVVPVEGVCDSWAKKG